MWIVRGVAVVTLVVVVLGVTGMTYQSIATSNDRNTFVAQGQIISVNGYDVHLNCTGQGSPTVILEAGLGLPSLSWGLIQPTVSERTRVCSYDRSGLGWSDSRPEERTAQQLAAELDELLMQAGIDDDLIFVSHSFGGLITRLYADQYPDRIAGIVMVDALLGEEYSPACNTGCFSDDMLSTVTNVNNGIEFLARFGVVRLAINNFSFPLFEVAQTLPDELRPAIAATFSTVQHWQTNNAEFASIGRSAEQALAASDFGTIPMIVISAGSTYDGQDVPGMTSEAAESMWMLSQTMLAALSANSTHIVLADATHNSLLTDPDHAKTVIEAIVDLMNL